MSEPWSPTRTVRRRRRRTGVVSLAVAVLAAGAGTALLIGRLPSGDGPAPRPVGAPATRSVAAPGTRPAGVPATRPATAPPGATTSAPTPTARLVRVTAQQSDGEVYGVGLPIVLRFAPAPRDVAAFEHATAVTVNGRPAAGAWYWEQPTADDVHQHVVEAHYRPRTFWPAHSHVHVALPIGGLSAGRGLVYAGRLTSLDFRIGAAHVTTVDARSLRMHVTSDGRPARTLDVSLGAAATPTFNGVKVVMQKGENVPGTGRLRPHGTVLMSGPHYTDHAVQWSVRITRSGEYVHSAPWNSRIGRASTSNGCTNLAPADAEWFYRFSRMGDVVRYANTDGGPMPSEDGLGDWNVAWTQWRQGGPARPAA